MKRGIWIAIAVLLVLLFAARFFKKKGVVEKIKEKVPVEVQTASMHSIERWVPFTGVVEGIEQAPALPDLPGKFMKFVVKEGAYVRKGDVIAYLEREVPGLKIKPVPVKSPISGIVSLSDLDKGMPVMQNTPVALVANISRFKIRLNIPGDIKVHIGDPVYVFFKDKKIYGKITYLSRFLDPVSGTRRVTCVFQNKGNLLSPGDFVKVFIRSVKKGNVIAVPVDAVIGVEEKYVFRVKSGKAVETPVITGVMNNEFIEIKEGLSLGDTIIVIGQNIVKDGSPVYIRGSDD